MLSKISPSLYKGFGSTPGDGTYHAQNLTEPLVIKNTIWIKKEFIIHLDREILIYKGLERKLGASFSSKTCM